MNALTVLIGSAGTGSAVSIIKSLRQQNDLQVRLIAADSDPSAPGMHLAEDSVLVPKLDDPEFLTAIKAVAKNRGPLVYLPTYSREVRLVSAHADMLRIHGVSTLLSPPQAVSICDDKLEFGEFAKCQDLRVPSANPSANGPVFVKPKVGSGSKGARKFEHRSDAERAIAADPGLMMQEFIAGDEVTVDVFINRDQSLIAASARRRLAVKDGQSVKGLSIPNTPFLPAITKIARELKLQGAANFQFILNEDRPVLIEVNPRFAAGGLMLTVASGLNIPLLVVKEALGIPIRKGELSPRTGLMMARYWEEVFWSNQT